MTQADESNTKILVFVLLSSAWVTLGCIVVVHQHEDVLIYVYIYKYDSNYSVSHDYMWHVRDLSV